LSSSFSAYRQQYIEASISRLLRFGVGGGEKKFQRQAFA
jgi:hypothetical protein